MFRDWDNGMMGWFGWMMAMMGFLGLVMLFFWWKDTSQ